MEAKENRSPQPHPRTFTLSNLRSGKNQQRQSLHQHQSTRQQQQDAGDLDEVQTRVVRHEAHHPQAVSYTDQGPGRNQGRGIRAARNRKPLADIYPEAAVGIIAQSHAIDYGKAGDDNGGDAGHAGDGGIKGQQEGTRASDDLAWSLRDGRDDIVDQLLSSFEQLDNSTPGTPIATNPAVTFPSGVIAPPNQSLSTSTSHLDDKSTHSPPASPSRTNYVSAIPWSPGRHTKNKSSGSNFTATLDRIDSVRSTAHFSDSPAAVRAQNRRPSTQGRARAGSKSSGSLDYGHSFSLAGLIQAARRSKSFDQGSSARPFGNGGLANTMDSDREQGMPYGDSEGDGAQAPSIPRGRRPKKGSISSIGSFGLRPSRSRSTGLRKPGSSPQRANTGDSAAPAPTIAREPYVQAAPAVSSVRHKPTQSSGYKAMAFSPNAAAAKEKGGFFKRMFGSRNTAPTAGDAHAHVQSVHTSPMQDGGAASGPGVHPDMEQQQQQQPTGSKRQQPATQKSSHEVSAAQSAPPQKPEPKEPATLNKKPSFFRRRKKSIASAVPAVPTLPMSSTWQASAESRDQSPASSLRKVMNPYLASRPMTRGGRPPSRPDTGPSPEQHEVRLRPYGDTGIAYGAQATSYHDPATQTQLPRHNAKDDTERGSTLNRDNAPAAATHLEVNDGGERRARNTAATATTNTITTTTTTTTTTITPKRSSSVNWRDRSSTRRSIYQALHRHDSPSPNRRVEMSRTETQESEVSDSDFRSAKSQVTSPAEEKPKEVFTVPSVPSMTISRVADSSNEANGELTTTYGTSKSKGEGFTTLDPHKTPTYVPPAEEEPAVLQIEEEDPPTDEDIATADQLFRFKPDEPPDDSSLPTKEEEICPWLGEAGKDRARVRKAYLEMFDWKDISILGALRRFCEHVKLKGETQQVDRILEGIARRWSACNPLHGFKAVDVVHTISYSLLLLNTDLHMADIEKKMTRPQFILNTLPTVMRVVDDAAPDAFKQSTINAAKRASMAQSSASKPAPLDLSRQTALAAGSAGPNSPHSPSSPRESGTVKLSIRRNSNEFSRNKFRLSTRPSDNYALETLLGANSGKSDQEPLAAVANEDCGPLVKQPFFGGRAAWETQIETVLKNFYTAIQKQKLPLQGSDGPGSRDYSRAPSSLGGQQTATGRPGRSASLSSKQSDGRGRNLESRGTVSGATSRWTSKVRQRPKIYAASNFSVDDDMSMSGISPSASSMWSKYSLGRTQTSMSVTSFRSEGAGKGKEAYQQSIGFANALSQAIIREEGGAPSGDAGDADERDSEAIKAASLLEDDSLELYGAPWAKEGIVKHKHHLESVDKKAKERAWTECFAVIQKGWLQMFRFNSSKASASLRSRTLRAAVGGGSSGVSGGVKGVPGPDGKIVVGGGNWMDNALPLGRFLLRQTIASALPPPGYSKSRPHVWALSLPNGAVHLFQAGTPEIVKEYVTCANYWSARLSKEPLVGAVSNVEYGWSENVLGNSLVATSTGRPSTSDPAVLLPAGPSSMAEIFSMQRQRSGSSGSAVTANNLTTGVPARSGSRGFSIGTSNRPPSSMHSARPSLQNSIRTSFDTVGSSAAAAVIRPRLPGDHVKIAEWTPPAQSMVASALMEVDQLRVLSDYIANVKHELEKHNELRPAIQLTYNPRHPNYARAMANFERKSAYLLREIVKFSTYVEILQAAQAKKDEINREREERRRELDAGRDDGEGGDGDEPKQKFAVAEDLRRELSRSDLRVFTATTDVPNVPALPISKTGAVATKE